MAGRKKKPKKRGGKRGAKKGARRSSAKRGAAKRTTLRAGMLVSGKPRKDSLKKHCLTAKKVGKTERGKVMYKLASSKACRSKKSASSSVQKQARAMLKAEGVKRPTKKQVAARVRVARSFGRLKVPAGRKKETMTPEQWESLQKSKSAFGGFRGL